MSDYILGSFLGFTIEESSRLYVDYLNAVRIPELRRSVKFRLGIDNDTFEELLIRLVENKEEL